MRLAGLSTHPADHRAAASVVCGWRGCEGHNHINPMQCICDACWACPTSHQNICARVTHLSFLLIVSTAVPVSPHYQPQRHSFSTTLHDTHHQKPNTRHPVAPHAAHAHEHRGWAGVPVCRSLLFQRRRHSCWAGS
jgi:hypothetical protein